MKKIASFALVVPVAAGLIYSQTQSNPGSSSSQQSAQQPGQSQSTTQPDKSGTQMNRGSSERAGFSTTGPWRGTLVDASCVLPTSTSSSSSSSSQQMSSSTSGTTIGGQAEQTKSASRDTTSQERRSSSTTEQATSSDRSRSSEQQSTSSASRSETTQTSPSSSHQQSAQTGTTDKQRGSTADANRRTTGYSEEHSADRSRSEVHHRTLPRNCGITSTTTSFALIAPGGRLVYFDDASNAKIAQEIKTGNWSGASSSEFSQAAQDNRNIYRVNITGRYENEKIQVDSIER